MNYVVVDRNFFSLPHTRDIFYGIVNKTSGQDIGDTINFDGIIEKVCSSPKAERKFMYNKLRAKLHSQNLSVYRLAQMTGICSSDLYKALGGNIKFYDGWQQRIADALGCDKVDLFCGDGDTDGKGDK